MSVINRMLRDLDQRSQAANAAAAAAPTGVLRPVADKGRKQVSTPVALGVIAVALALGGGAWYLNRTTGMLGFLFPAPAQVPQFKVRMEPPPPPVVVAAPAPVVASAPVTLASAPAAVASAAIVVAAAAPAAAPAASAPAPVLTAGKPATAAASAAPARQAASAAAVAATVPPLPAPSTEQRPVGAKARTAAVQIATPSAAAPPAVPEAAAAPVSSPARTQADAAPRSSGGKTYSASQLQANLMAEAVRLDQQGRLAEAKLPLQKVLESNPQATDARQLLVQLHMETGRLDEARVLLAEGRQLQPANPGFALALGRLQLEGGDAASAVRTLTDAVPPAARDPQHHALLAAAQLKLQQFESAAQNYLAALRSDPANPHWLVGVGVAWEATGKRADALEAYRRADAGENLPPELSRFIADRIARLSR